MSTLDERLRHAFRTIDVPPDFETRVLARVHAAGTERLDERVTAARTWAEQSYNVARRELRLWRRAALRMLTLDALGALTLLIVLMTALPHVAPKIVTHGSNYSSYVILVIAIGLAALSVRRLSLFTDARRH
jgi:hypothetical protein